MLTYGEASSATGKALASGCGLTIAVYAGMKAAVKYLMKKLHFLYICMSRIPHQHRRRMSRSSISSLKKNKLKELTSVTFYSN